MMTEHVAIDESVPASPEHRPGTIGCCCGQFCGKSLVTGYTGRHLEVTDALVFRCHEQLLADSLNDASDSSAWCGACGG